MEAALPQLRVREGQPPQHGKDQHHGVLGNADGRAARRDGERDAALGQRRGVDGVVVADALVVHEGELPPGLDQRPREAGRGDDRGVGVGELRDPLRIVVALERDQLAAPGRGVADHAVERGIGAAVVEDALHGGARAR